VRHSLHWLAALISLACTEGARDTATADTAALHGDSLSTDTTPVLATGDSLPRGDSLLASADSASSAITAVVIVAADSAAGDSLYRRKGRCLACHGPDARGIANLGANLRDAEWLHGNGSVTGIAEVIAGGVARPKQAQIRMPAFASQLSSDEIQQLAMYVYAISHAPATAGTTTSDAMTRDSARRVKPDST
jgi:mono/diheme cytochrome c family protein